MRTYSGICARRGWSIRSPRLCQGMECCRGRGRRARGRGRGRRALWGECSAHSFEEGPFRGKVLCSKCAGQGGATPVSDSVPLRALLVYALVEEAGGADSVFRMKPVRAVVAAPPARWRWGAPLTNEPEPTEAQPEWKLLSRGSHWRYSSPESDQIWCSSKPFRGTAAV